MPPKIKDLAKQLERAGFENRGGKVSHRNHKHAGAPTVTLSGKLGDGSKRYQIKIVN